MPGRLQSTEATELQALLTWSLQDEDPRQHKDATPIFQMVPGGGIGLHDRFDVVSIQFAIHYMMKTKARARRFFRTVSQLLDVGGSLIATTTDARVLLSHLMNLGLDFGSIGESPKEGEEKGEPIAISVGGGACEIKFDRHIVQSMFQTSPETDKVPDSAFGLQYSFLLLDGSDQAAVNLPEWLTPIPILVALAQEVGLELEYADNFHDFYQQRRHDASAHKRLLNMKVFNRTGTISQDEWDISRLYLALKFRKVREIE